MKKKVPEMGDRVKVFGYGMSIKARWPYRNKSTWDKKEYFEGTGEVTGVHREDIGIIAYYVAFYGGCGAWYDCYIEPECVKFLSRDRK